MTDVGYLAIRNWRKYQMYRVPEPHYIKLYVHILDDKKVQALSPLTRLLWYQLLPMAARYQNAIPKNISAIAKETRLERHYVSTAVEKLLEIRLISETKTARRTFERGKIPPAELMEAFIQNGGYQLTSPSLAEEMSQRGVPESERERLLELAGGLATRGMR